MDKEAWEEKKRRNRELERRAKTRWALRPGAVKPGDTIKMQSGGVYKVAEDKSWRRVK